MVNKTHKIYKIKKGRQITGVCGGIAKHFGWNPTVVRVLWILLDLCFGIGVIAYIVADFMMPSEEA